ncbi:B-cell receptor-associated protein [Trema orientale]|uniref:Endoplasmic reticulum transmembrane protein n=1 Tax=Trema orientale TaxID=63057 RepID=A0A2P5F2B4_TREOI|nr:B-cell receptor-associated protein [Trema orientale]
MIQLLFMLVVGEMALILTLMFKTPLRKLMILGLDQLKQGRRPLVVKSVGGTMLVVFISTLYVVMDIQKRSSDTGVVNPTDEVLKAQRLLEASLIGIKSI